MDLKEIKIHTGVYASLADIPHGSALNHVADGEPLDRLVLADTARAVRAAHELNVATTLLVAAVTSSFLSLQGDSESGQQSVFMSSPIPDG